MFEKVFMRLIKTGLDVKWRFDYDHANKIDQKIDIRNLDNEESTLHIVFIFSIIAEIALSLIVWLLEYLWQYLLKNQINRKFTTVSYF